MRTSVPFAVDIDYLEAILSTTDVTAYEIRPLFGPHDFLVIYWATHQKSRWLRQRFSDNEAFEPIHSLAVEAVHYISTSAPKDPTNDRTWTLELERAWQGNNEISNDLLTELIENGLVMEVESDSANLPHTLYAYLSPIHAGAQRSSGSINANSVLRRITEICPEGIKIRHFACGRSEAVMELTCTEYGPAYAFLRQLASMWNEYGTRTETSIVASEQISIVDQLDVDWRDVTADEERLIAFLSPLASFRDITSLDKGARMMLTTLYADHQGLLLSTPNNLSHFEPFFRDLLAARLIGDGARLQASLNFIPLLEAYFREVLKKHWIEKLGKQWHREVRASGIRVTKSETFDPSKATFAQLIDVANSIKKTKEFLHHELGEDWGNRLAGLKDLRNDFAHGRIALSTEYVSDKWEYLADTVLSVGALYNTFAKLYEQRCSREKQ
ncbi:hypothetical protein [Rhodopirellula europaea]|uniref:hypothetical protein n=1 Tax=Rhodopirellula europaea TaxID=1263866 RepID=UPI003D278885